MKFTQKYFYKKFINKNNIEPFEMCAVEIQFL